MSDSTAILERIEPWAGSREAAAEWYRSYPIPPLGGRTAEEVVNSGEAELVFAYLDHIKDGGYA